MLLLFLLLMFYMCVCVILYYVHLCILHMAPDPDTNK